MDYLGYAIMCASAIAAFVLLLVQAPEESFAWIIGAAILGFVIQLYSFWRNRPATLLPRVNERTTYNKFVQRSLEVNKSYAEIETHIRNFVTDEQLRDELLLELHKSRNTVK